MTSPARPFAIEDATIAGIHAARRAGRTSAVVLVQASLDRIAAYDVAGPALNALITVNPRALELAAACDRAPSDLPLHGIPIVVKDNFDTADMPTTGGARTLAGSVPPDDAWVVQRLRAAGAIVIAKANLTELARGGTTVSSLGGQTKNPYDRTRTPGGSSGGTGAAVAAGFAVAGIGSDTNQSIRSPSSANSLVGLRGTRGLISRDGVIPYSLTQDEAGPMARTVEDLAWLLDVIAGYDPADPVTALSYGRIPRSFLDALDPGGLDGARIGVLVDVFGAGPEHEPVNQVMVGAMQAMRAAGATLVTVRVPDLAALTAGMALAEYESGAALAAYFASLGPAAPVASLAAFVAKGEYHPAIAADLAAAVACVDGMRSPAYLDALRRRDALRVAMMGAFAAEGLDALLYPHQRRLVARIGEEQLERNGVLANGTGLPALTVPAGFSEPTADAPLGVPVGLELLGPDWSEPTLLRLGFAFEQATRARRPPVLE